MFSFQNFLFFLAITLVAVGTSLPDTFASVTATRQEVTADNAIGNINGSNSVNVFLGLGLPWLLAAIYHASKVCIEPQLVTWWLEMPLELHLKRQGRREGGRRRGGRARLRALSGPAL